MKAGHQFVVQVGDTSVGVFYKTHFVERYNDRRGGKVAPSDRIDEQTVGQKITAAMPQIVDILAIDSAAQGVIFSRKLRFNMTFELRETNRGPVVVMTSIMCKPDFIKRSMTDYEIEINPPPTVRFRRGLSEPLRVAVIADLAEFAGTLQDETAYHLGGEEVDYWVEIDGDFYYVDEAGWKHDLYEISVA